MTAQPPHGAPRDLPGARPGAGRSRRLIRSRVLAVLAVAAGSALLIVVAAAGYLSRPAPDVGAAQARQLAAASPSATAVAGPGPTAVAEPPPAGAAPPVMPVVPVVPVVPVTDGALPAEATIAPVRLAVPAIGLTAAVDAVGIDRRTGEFDVPPSVDRIGWYRYGPGLDAAAGSLVIAGHVDGAGQGRGAFFRLRDLAAGAVITVAGADGRDRRYQVVAREEYAKTKIPLDRYFARDGAPRLTLITCGGPFDAGQRRYRDNIVVTARAA